MDICPYSGIPWNCELCPEDECPLYFCKITNKFCYLKYQCDENLMKARNCYKGLKQQDLFENQENHNQ